MNTTLTPPPVVQLPVSHSVPAAALGTQPQLPTATFTAFLRGEVGDGLIELEKSSSSAQLVAE